MGIKIDIEHIMDESKYNI